MNWIVPKIWEDGTCFIIGGGSSIVKQFDIPAKTVEAVIAKRETPASYSPYLSVLHNKHVIGVNQSFRIGDWIDIVFFGDKRFFLQNQDDLANLTNLRVGCVPYVRDIDWIKHLQKDHDKSSGITSNRSKVSWNGNSGGAAINLAVHLGVKRIILLGFDMNADENNRQWWHQLYKERAANKAKNVFKSHLKHFPAIAEDARRLDIEILNANPDSAIKCFPRIEIKHIL